MSPNDQLGKLSDLCGTLSACSHVFWEKHAGRAEARDFSLSHLGYDGAVTRQTSSPHSFQRNDRYASIALPCAIVLSLIWLIPFTFGPMAPLVPWLFAALSVSAIAAITGSVAPRAPMVRRGKRWLTAAAAAAAVILLFVCVKASSQFDLLALTAGLALIALSRQLAQVLPLSTGAGRTQLGRLVAGSWIVAGLVSSLYALVQYFGHASLLDPAVSWAPAGEAYANLRQRNQFASLTNISLAALLTWPVRERHISSRTTGMPACVLGAMALHVVANAASSSRTGLLQLLGLLVALLWWRRDRATCGRVVLVLAMYGAASTALPWIAGLDPATHGMLARLREGDSLCSSRLTLWANVIDLIAERPWSGWGWGELDYAHFMSLYDGPRFCDILDNAHNLPLHLAVELGVPVAVIFCASVVWWVKRSKPWRETDSVRQLAWLVIAILGIHSMFEYPLWYAPFQVALGLSLGLLSRPYAEAAKIQASTTSTWSQITPTVVIATAMFAACIYAAWDYRRISQIYLDPMARVPEYRFDTLGKIQGSWLFRRQVQFAELTTSTIAPQSAERVHSLALELLHFSPEARVVEKLVASAQLLGHEDEAAFYLKRYRAAFPVAYDKWVGRRRSPDVAGD